MNIKLNNLYNKIKYIQECIGLQGLGEFYIERTNFYGEYRLVDCRSGKDIIVLDKPISILPFIIKLQVNEENKSKLSEIITTINIKYNVLKTSHKNNEEKFLDLLEWDKYS